jgi:hypothetical protein
MTKLFIPALGTRLHLSKEWTFVLTHDYLNKGLVSALRLDKREASWNRINTDTVTIPAGAIIKVDRYDVKRTSDAMHQKVAVVLLGRRQQVKIGGKLVKGNHRFYVTLAEANEIEFDGVEDPNSAVD